MFVRTTWCLRPYEATKSVPQDVAWLWKSLYVPARRVPLLSMEGFYLYSWRVCVFHDDLFSKACHPSRRTLLRIWRISYGLNLEYWWDKSGSWEIPRLILDHCPGVPLFRIEVYLEPPKRELLDPETSVINQTCPILYSFRVLASSSCGYKMFHRSRVAFYSVHIGREFRLFGIVFVIWVIWWESSSRQSVCRSMIFCRNML